MDREKPLLQCRMMKLWSKNGWNMGGYLSDKDEFLEIVERGNLLEN